MRTGLLGVGETVLEGVSGRDRALCDEGRAVGPVVVVLEEAVPVLPLCR